MGNINITLTDEQRKSIEELANRENLSTDEYISMTLSEKVTSGSREAFLKLLKRAPDVQPDAGDSMAEVIT
jgi:hypothetical protein